MHAHIEQWSSQIQKSRVGTKEKLIHIAKPSNVYKAMWVFISFTLARAPFVVRSFRFVSFCRLSGFHAYCVCSVLSVRICLWIWYMCYCCCGRSSASPTDIAAFSSQFSYKCAFMCIWFSRILTVTSCGCTNSFFHKNFKSNWNLLFFHFKTFFPSVYFQLVRGFVFDSQIHEKTTIFLYI